MQNKIILTPYLLDHYEPDLATLAEADWQVNTVDLGDLGDLGDLDQNDRQARMSAIYRPLADAVAQAANEGKRPVAFNGDCCATIGVMAGLQRAGIDPILLWLDAHGDFNTWETSPSGFLGGMPLAMLVGRGEQTMVTATGMATFPEEQVVFYDGRDLDPGERAALQNSGVHHVQSINELIDFPWPDRPLYVHFDSDVLRLEDAPAMNYPATGGPSAEEVRTLFRALVKTGKIAAVSITPWTFSLDPVRKTQQVVMELLHELIA